MRRLIAVSLLFVALGVGPAWSAGASRYGAVHKLIVDKSMGMLSLMAAIDDPGKIGQSAAITNESLKKDINAALVAAKGKPDLLKATKEFYVAATAYFDAAYFTDFIGKAKASTLQTEMESRQKALDLELTLAGD